VQDVYRCDSTRSCRHLRAPSICYSRLAWRAFSIFWRSRRSCWVPI
jgi:hypothetical protein